MSKTVVAARQYVADIIGGRGSQEGLDMANDAILRTYQDWQNKKFWRFLLKDTSLSTRVSAPAAANGATLSANGTMIALLALDFVNIGQTVTYSGSAGSLAANTTVLSYTRNTDGTIATVTLSNAVAGIGATEAGTFTFSANIPVIAGTNDYNLPIDYNAPFTARLTTVQRPLTWRDPRVWDRIITDPSALGTPSDYTHFNPYSDLTQNFGTMHLKFDRVPSANDTLVLKYYRKFSVTASNIDVPDDFLYQFLDYARNVLLALKKAADDPQAYRKDVLDATQSAADTDEEPTDDNDADQCMKSQYEMGTANRALWGNGAFDPYRYYD